MDPSTGADPFDAAKEEVCTTLSQCQLLHGEWKRMLQSNVDKNKVNRLEGNLRGSLNGVYRDVCALERAVQAAMQHPQKFNISHKVAEGRRDFVEEKMRVVKHLQVDLQFAKEAANRSADVYIEPSLSSHAFCDAQRQQQQTIVDQQEAGLSDISAAAMRLSEAAHTINYELQTQKQMIDDLDTSVDQQAAEMNVVMRKMAKILQTSDLRQLCTILWLSCVAILLFILVVVS